LPSLADRRAVGLDTLLDGVLDDVDLGVVLDALDDRAPDLADGRVTVPDFRGGMAVPSPAELLPLVKADAPAARSPNGQRSGRKA
jgi:hypothetical protein